MLLHHEERMMELDLQNGNITIGQILRMPKAKAILVRELPELMNSPLVSLAGNMSLNQVLSLSKGRVAPAKVKSILEQLKAL